MGLDSRAVVSPDGPVRTCIGCRQRAATRELLRIVAGPGAHAVPDPHGTARGRGAHMHPATECYELAVRRRAFGRALRVPGGLDAAPVKEYLAALTHDRPSASPPGDRENWSSSS